MTPNSFWRKSGVCGRAALTIARLFLVVTLPFWGLQTIHPTTALAQHGNGETSECRDVKHTAQQLARATRQLMQIDRDLAIHVLSVNTGVSEDDIDASMTNQNVNLLTRAVIIASLAGIPLSDAMQLVSGGHNLCRVLENNQVMLADAQDLLTTVLTAVNANIRAANQGLVDTDGDGIPNLLDPDIDGDGILNGDDDDVDGDGILNGDDSDVDGDGIPNATDDDVDGDGVGNGNDDDIDGDGIPNAEDTDDDGDGAGDDTDEDDDGDGVDDDDDTDDDALQMECSPHFLSPDDGQLVTITITVTGDDTVDASTIQLVSVTSNQTLAADDVQGADIGTNDTELMLRATRSGNGSRVYHINYEAQTTDGDTVTSSCTVVVKKSHGA
jgi:hypothetical protein